MTNQEKIQEIKILLSCIVCTNSAIIFDKDDFSLSYYKSTIRKACLTLKSLNQEKFLKIEERVLINQFLILENQLKFTRKRIKNLRQEPKKTTLRLITNQASTLQANEEEAIKNLAKFELAVDNFRSKELEIQLIMVRIENKFSKIDL